MEKFSGPGPYDVLKDSPYGSNATHENNHKSHPLCTTHRIVEGGGVFKGEPRD